MERRRVPSYFCGGHKPIRPRLNNYLFLLITGYDKAYNGKQGKNWSATTSSNKKGQVIDGIWGTEDIHVSDVGYIMFNQGPYSYHILLWVSILHLEAFVEEKLPIRSRAACKLRMQHPRGQGRHIPQLRILPRQ